MTVRTSPHRMSIVLALVSVVVVVSCSGGGASDDSATWVPVQSGVDGALSWRLFRAVLPLPGTPAKGTCLAIETTPSIADRPALRQFPNEHKGKKTFCGLPDVEVTDAVVGGFKLMVVGSDIDATGGWHDTFGLTDPDVTKVTGSFKDGPVLEAHHESGTFVLLWEGPKVLDKLTAFAGDAPVGECTPPGRAQSDFLNLQSSQASPGLFTCGPRP